MTKRHWYYMTTKDWYKQIKILKAYSHNDRDVWYDNDEVWWNHTTGNLLRIIVRPDKVFEMQNLGWVVWKNPDLEQVSNYLSENEANHMIKWFSECDPQNAYIKILRGAVPPVWGLYNWIVCKVLNNAG